MRTLDRVRQPALAGWTAGSRVMTLPEGRATRVNPSLTAIFKEELACKCGLFFRMLHLEGRMRTLDRVRQPASAGWTAGSRVMTLPEG